MAARTEKQPTSPDLSDEGHSKKSDSSKGPKNHKKEPSDVVEIRKYSNRRLYDTSASRYITLAELGDMIRKGVEIRVKDAKTGQNLTRTVMLQIILESEQEMNLLPISFLRKVIEASSGAVTDSFRSTLVSTMDLFTQLYEDFQTQVTQMSRLGSVFPPMAFQWMNYLNRYFQQTLGGSPKPPKEPEPQPGKSEGTNTP